MGRVAGIPVGLHWSVLGIVLLLIIGLSMRLPVVVELGGCAGGRALVFDHGRPARIVSPTDISRATMLHGLTAGIGSGGPDVSPGSPSSR